MNAELEIGLYTVVIPAITAVIVACLLPRGMLKSWAGFAVAAGCCVGYVVLPEWAPLVPQRHWQWIYYLTPMAALVGGIIASRPTWWVQVGLLSALGLLVAWLVVPTWNTLSPSRVFLIPALACYLAALSFLLVRLPERLQGRTFCGLLAATAAATAMLVAFEVSLMIGQAAAIGAVALGGCSLALFWRREAGASLGLIPVFATACGSFAFAGAIEPSEPVWILLFVPAAPLLLWLFAAGPFARLPAVAAIIAQTVMVALVPLAIGIWFLCRAQPADEWSAADTPPPTITATKD